MKQHPAEAANLEDPVRPVTVGNWVVGSQHQLGPSDQPGQLPTMNASFDPLETVLVTLPHFVEKRRALHSTAAHRSGEEQVVFRFVGIWRRPANDPLVIEISDNDTFPGLSEPLPECVEEQGSLVLN